MAAQQQMTGDQQKLMEEVMCAIKACLNSVKGEIPMETLHSKSWRTLALLIMCVCVFVFCV